MKKYILSSIILAAAFVSLHSCRDKEEPPKEVTWGHDVLQVKIADTLWKPYEPGLFTPPSHRPYAVFYSSINLFELYGVHIKNKEMLFLAVEGMNGEGFYRPGYRSARSELWDTLPNGYNHCSDSTRFEFNYNCDSSYKLLDRHTSRVEIQHWDTIKQVIGGKFELRLWDGEKEINFKEGFFDTHYQKF